MAAAPVQVQVVGLRALVRDIGRMTADNGPLLAAFKQAGRTAAEPVAAATRSAMQSGTTPASGPPHLADDIRVGATRTGASVRMGRSSLRWAGWVEFGGTRRVPHQSHRDYNPRGRYLFPAAIQMAPRAAQLYAEAVNRVVAEYPWSNDTTQGESVHD